MIFSTVVWLSSIVPFAGATTVLPTATFCELALRTARTAPRAIGPAGATLLRETLAHVRTDPLFRRQTYTDVKPNFRVREGLLTFADPAAEVDDDVTVVAREFIDEDEIRRALITFRAELATTGSTVVDQLAERYPRERATELARLFAGAAAVALPNVLMTGHAVEIANLPLAFTTVYFNDLRRRRARDERHGVPGLERQLRTLDLALLDTPATRREHMRRALSYVRGTVEVSPEVMRTLTARGDRPPTPTEIEWLVDSGAPLRVNLMDRPANVPAAFALTIESVVFTEWRPDACRLRWMIYFRARRLRAPSDGGVRLPLDRRGLNSLPLRS